MRGIEHMAMEPFYFRQSCNQLFGVYHPAQTEASHNVGVVLCHPMGQEYIRSHRSLLQLAQLLSSAGFDVLRFDLYGCGDSDGDFSQGSIRQWVADISAAVDELNGGCNPEGMCLVGLRLAGALAVMAGAERGDIDSIVLWDTVIDGTAYLEELIGSHDDWLQRSFARSRPNHENHHNNEVLGFPITDSMKRELADINLLALERKPATNVFVVESQEASDTRLLCECLRRVEVDPRHKHVPCPKVWVKRNHRGSGGLVPMPILRSVVEWIRKVHQ